MGFCVIQEAEQTGSATAASTAQNSVDWEVRMHPIRAIRPVAFIVLSQFRCEVTFLQSGLTGKRGAA